MDQPDEITPLRKKIDELNQQAWDIRVHDSPGSFRLSEEAVELSRKINYDKGLAQATQSLGFCYVRLSKNDEALPLIRESQALFESLNDIIGQSSNYEYLAIISRTWGRFGEALELLFKALELAEQADSSERISTILYQTGVTYKQLGNFEKALDYLYKSITIHRKLNKPLFESYPINIIGTIYFDNGDYAKALDYYQQALVGRQDMNDKWGEAGSLDNIGFTYFKLHDHQKAIENCLKSLDISVSTNDTRSQAGALIHLAQIYKATGEIQRAVISCHESLRIRKEMGDRKGEAEVLLFLGDMYKGSDSGQNAETFERLSSALAIAEEIKSHDLLSKARFQLFEFYKQTGEFKKAVEQLEIHNALEKELHKNSIDQKVSSIEITHKAEEAKKETDEIKKRNKELTKLNEQVEKQKRELEQSLKDLKAAQQQLIQSEKMASLGELTAGIAHEIQNPLNFVNNFSEVNGELIAELQEQLAIGNLEQANELSRNLKENEEKILNHGKRADAIVKNMLQHSRGSTGKKEPTDINALVDEYLRLSYHGLRAKDKGFQSKYETDFDPALEKVDLVARDIGHVLLNLINNAFYAVNEKKHVTRDPAFKPSVHISTKKSGKSVILTVKDNGNGIPQQILDKIFQPFFTTKPTGEGTGLGLSLSYDIVKAHGGELSVETKEGEGSQFTLCIPIKH